MSGIFKNFGAIPNLPSRQVEVKILPTFSYSEPVVNSEQVKWKPIDQVAARVVTPAKWYHRPPPLPPTFMNNSERELQPNQYESTGGRVRTKRVMTAEGHVEEMFNRKDIAAPAVEEHENRLKNQVKVLESLNERAHELLDAISYILRSSGEPFAEAEKQLTSHLTALREKRFAVETETRLILSQLKDVRQFFLDQNYEAQIDRLRDFVSICERLKDLKDSGFLDTVADTMIRLANRES